MDNRLHKIISESSDNFDDWIEILNRHRESFYLHVEHDESKTDSIYKTVDVLANIINIDIRLCNFKDNFDTSKMYLNLYGPCLIIKSEKTKASIVFSHRFKWIIFRDILYSF